MHISKVFETEEDDEALERPDITDTLSQGYLTVDIEGSILMTTTFKILVQNYHDIFSTTVKGKSDRVPS